MTVLGQCTKKYQRLLTKNSLKQGLAIITMFDPESFIISEQNLTIQCISLTKAPNRIRNLDKPVINEISLPIILLIISKDKKKILLEIYLF